MKKSITTYAYDDTIGVTLVYDTGAGNHLKGRLAAVYDASGERHFSYDANGYPDYEERVVAGVSYLTGYDFDAAGNLRAMIYPTGQAAAISAGSVFDRGYGLDNTGNITAITDNLNPSRSQSFAYDDLNRLTGATGIYGTLAFTYDRTGNRLTGSISQGTDTYTYVPGTNRLDTITGTQTINFDHDSQGNLIGRTFVTGPGPNTTEIPDYTYTYDGQRTAKTLTAGTTVYHYDLAGRLIAETAAGNMLKAYVWLHGQPLAMIAADGSVYYYHNDHLGTPQKMTEASGAVVWAADYLPFGKADVTMAAVENNLRASGQYYDAETGLHYNYWRFYDPGLGRYLRADPLGLVGGINPYAYVANNPINAIDPYGLLVLYWGGGAAAGAGLNADHNYYSGAINRYKHIRMKDFKLTQSGLSTTLSHGNILGLTGGGGFLAGINFSNTKSYQDSTSHGFVILGITVGWTKDNNGVSGIFFGYGGKGGGLGYFNEWFSDTTLYPAVTWIEETTGPCP